MFTGIIESLGEVLEVRPIANNIELYVSSGISDSLKIDQSVAHNGVCLTVDQIGPGWHRCTLISESLNKSNFKNIRQGDYINLERSVIIGSRLDGHFVQGHVDTTTICLDVRDDQGSWVFKFDLPRESVHLVVPKGSITINGVSLTISLLTESFFEVSVIPYTYGHTNFNRLQSKDVVNVEFDILGKYIARIMSTSGLGSVKF